jgi:hypothetical protein
MKILVKILRHSSAFPEIRVFLLAAILTAALSAPAGAVQFRQMPDLPAIPQSITFPAERSILQADREALADRRRELGKNRAEYDRECSERLASNASLRRSCSFLVQEIRRESSHLRVDINALRARFQTVEADALRHSGGVKGPASTGGVETPDARTKFVREALAESIEGWFPVLSLLKKSAGKGTGNPALRDAFAYLRAMYEGRIVADDLENAYYKHGVRRWLAGDMWSAALSFARAARDNPEDRRVFASFADAAARQHASPACVKAHRCVSGDVAAWAKRFGLAHERALKQLLSVSTKTLQSANIADIRNILGAIAIYAAKTESDSGGTEPSSDRTTKALAYARSGDRTVAFEEYVRLWRYVAPDREKVFFARYAAASGSRAARKFLGEDGVSSGDAGAEDRYLTRVRAAFRTDSGKNPFSGALTQAQIIRLQR